MKNLGQMMKRAQQMQDKLTEMQAKLDSTEITGKSGGGMVEVTLSGKGAARSVKIDPSLAGPDDVEVLEDLIAAAINDARAKLDEHVTEKMAEVTGGLRLPPGMGLPF